MNSGKRAEGLDGLRGLAAVAVVLLHVWMFSGAHQPEQAKLTDEIVGSMGLALMMFFVLSGYLVAAPWIRAGAEGRPAPDLARYAARRIARIAPAYWLCLAGSFVLMQWIDHPLAVEASELPLFALFLQNQVTATAGQLNPPLWSLGVEVAFYAALPFIGIALIAAIRRWGTRGALLVSAAMIGFGLLWTAYVHQTGEDPTLVAALPTYLPIFACGIATAALLRDRSPRRPLRGALLVVGAGLVVADGWWHADSTGFVGHVVRDLPAGMGFAMIAAAVAHGPAWILGSAPLRRLGDISYGLYLWHMPVLYFLFHTGRWPESPWEAFVVVLTGSIVAGAASWLLLERPVVAWAARRLRRGPRPTEAPGEPSVERPIPAHAAEPEPALVYAGSTGAPTPTPEAHAPTHPRGPSGAHPTRVEAGWTNQTPH